MEVVIRALSSHGQIRPQIFLTLWKVHAIHMHKHLCNRFYMYTDCTTEDEVKATYSFLTPPVTPARSASIAEGCDNYPPTPNEPDASVLTSTPTPSEPDTRVLRTPTTEDIPSGTHLKKIEA